MTACAADISNCTYTWYTYAVHAAYILAALSTRPRPLPPSMLNSVPSDLARSPFHSHLFFQRFPSLSSSSSSGGDFLTMGRRAKLAVKRERERTKKGRKKVATTRRRVVHNFSHRFLFKRWEHVMVQWHYGPSAYEGWYIPAYSDTMKTGAFAKVDADVHCIQR